MGSGVVVLAEAADGLPAVENVEAEGEVRRSVDELYPSPPPALSRRSREIPRPDGGRAYCGGGVEGLGVGGSSLRGNVDVDVVIAGGLEAWRI